MTEKPSHKAIVSALHRAVRGTPLSIFTRLAPGVDTASEHFNGELDDGTKVVFQRRTIAVQITEALSRAADGSNHRLSDGAYRLKDGVEFQVVDGHIDFDSVFKDPDGFEPFREYGAWREVVAIENPLLSLPDPSAITDVVSFLADDSNFYYAVQSGLDKPYKAYIAIDHILNPLQDGQYPLRGGRKFQVAGGMVHPDSLNDLKVHAYETTRLPGIKPTGKS